MAIRFARYDSWRAPVRPKMDIIAEEACNPTPVSTPSRRLHQCRLRMLHPPALDAPSQPATCLLRRRGSLRNSRHRHPTYLAPPSPGRRPRPSPLLLREARPSSSPPPPPRGPAEPLASSSENPPPSPPPPRSPAEPRLPPPEVLPSPRLLLREVPPSPRLLLREVPPSPRPPPPEAPASPSLLLRRTRHALASSS